MKWRNLANKWEISELMESIEKNKGKLGEFAKMEYGSSVIFPNEEHKKKCKKSVNAKMIVTTKKDPEILCVDIKWGDILSIDILSIMNLIPNSMKLSDLYQIEEQEDPEYILKGIIIYWGSHYYSYERVFIDGEEEWLRVDGKYITKKGKWEVIVRECIATLSIPTLVIYEKYKGSVLVPEIEKMKENFEIEEESMKEIVTNAKESREKRVYFGAELKLIRTDSAGVELPDEKEEDEDDDMEIEKRKEDGQHEDAKTSNDKLEGNKGDLYKPSPDDEPQKPMVGEDEWDCEHCGTINPNTDPRCSNCRKKNENIEMMLDMAEEEKKHLRK